MKIMYIVHIGYSIDLFADKKESIDFIREKKKEYIEAKKYIFK